MYVLFLIQLKAIPKLKVLKDLNNRAGTIGFGASSALLYRSLASAEIRVVDSLGICTHNNMEFAPVCVSSERERCWR